MDSRINVTVAPAGWRRPRWPLLSEFVNLFGVLLDQMYVGFSGTNFYPGMDHMILAWSLSNTNILIGDALVTENLPPFVPSKISGSKRSVFGSKWFIVGACSCGVFSTSYWPLCC